MTIRRTKSLMWLALTASPILFSSAALHAQQPAQLPSVVPQKNPLEQLGFTLDGFVQLDSFWDTGRSNPDYFDVVRPSSLATTNSPDKYGGGGEFNMSVRSSQLGLKGQNEVGGKTLKTWIEIDLLETGSKAGETGLHLRHAWGEWGGFGAGQTHSAFMDISIFPNSLQYWGPPGMVFNRNPQVRYTWRNEDSQFAVAFEQQNLGLDEEAATAIDPNLGPNVKAKSIFPDFTTHYRHTGSYGHVQLAGVLRSLKYETIGTAGNQPAGSDLGWGVNLSSRLDVSDNDAIKLQVVAGQGIASFMNDGGSNLAPHSGEGVAIPSVGALLYLDHRWNKTWTSSVGYSLHDIKNRNQQLDTAFSKGSYATANLLNRPNKQFGWSVEGYWVEREDKNGATGESFRLQFSFIWNFSYGAKAPSFGT